jgi:hypothetical protein
MLVVAFDCPSSARDAVCYPAPGAHSGALRSGGEQQRLAGVAMPPGNSMPTCHEHVFETRRTQWRNYTASRLGRCIIALPGGLKDMVVGSFLML